MKRLSPGSKRAFEAESRRQVFGAGQSAQVLVLSCRAWARYSGRIDAELGLGDLVILVKDAASGGDGSVVVHGPLLVTPRNWMPAGTEMLEEDDHLVFEHVARGERLEIWIEELYSRSQSPSELSGSLTKLGAEREFSDRLAMHPERIEPGLDIIEREYRTPAGPIDLLCRDRRRQLVAVEVKRRLADNSALRQLRFYLHHLEQMPEWRRRRPRGILVAPHLRRPTQALLNEEPRISFVRLGFEDLRTDQPR